MRTLSICLTDIPKDKIINHRNGKKYLNLVIFDNENADKFGNTFSVSIARTEQEKELAASGEKVKTIYLGNGKDWSSQASQKSQTQQPRTLVENKTDDLPF